MANPPVIVDAEGAADHCIVLCVACKTLRMILRCTVEGEEVHWATDLIRKKNLDPHDGIDLSLR